jgi:hypothetical protein
VAAGAKVGERVAWVAAATTALLLATQVGLALGSAADPATCAGLGSCFTAMQNLALMKPWPAIVASAFCAFLVGAIGLRIVAKRLAA